MYHSPTFLVTLTTKELRLRCRTASWFRLRDACDSENLVQLQLGCPLAGLYSVALTRQLMPRPVSIYPDESELHIYQGLQDSAIRR